MGVDSRTREQFDVSTHFEFGSNWKRYSKTIGAAQVARGVEALKRFLGVDSLHGKRFLDIGCGSGLHALAALRLGADHVTAFDFDQSSVETTRDVLNRFWQGKNYTVQQANILAIPEDLIESFPIVYSWGVLHHTGDLWGAIDAATRFVAP
jgi:2-polyprenyl-6-hydroxyphenyl methylase/3-demethylubiquinone-9 3-methyltransferase